MTRTYRLHHLRLSLRADAPLHALLADGLRFKGAVESAFDQAPHVHLVFHAAPPPEPVPDDAEPLVEYDVGIALSHDGACYYLARGTAVGVVDPEAQRVEVWLGEDYADLEDRETRALIFYFMAIALVISLAYQGHYALHAAVLDRGGRGLLISAPSGSGKTTATLNLLRAGWSYVSDDTVLLRRRNGGVEAVSYRRDFSLTPDTAAVFPELAARSFGPPPGLREKWRVDMDDFFPGRFVAVTRPRLLLFPQRTPDAPSRLEPLRLRDVFILLLSQSAIFITRAPGVREAYLAMLRDLANQGQALRLHAGPDLLDDPNRLDALLRPYLD